MVQILLKLEEIMLLLSKLALKLFDLLVSLRDLIGEILSAGPQCLELSWIQNVTAHLLVKLFYLNSLIHFSSLIL